MGIIKGVNRNETTIKDVAEYEHWEYGIAAAAEEE